MTRARESEDRIIKSDKNRIHTDKAEQLKCRPGESGENEAGFRKRNVSEKGGERERERVGE